MARKKVLMGGLAVVLLGAAGVIYVSGLGRPPRLSGERNVPGVCLACQKESQLHLRPGDLMPYKCPECGEHAAFTWSLCNACGKRFVPELMPRPGDGVLVPPGYVRCPECSSDDIVTYDPNMPSQRAATGDLPLPEWKP